MQAAWPELPHSQSNATMLPLRIKRSTAVSWVRDMTCERILGHVSTQPFDAVIASNYEKEHDPPAQQTEGKGRHPTRAFVNHRVTSFCAGQATIAAPLRKHALGLAMVVAILPDDAVASGTRHANAQRLADATMHDIPVEGEPLEPFFRTTPC